MSHRNSFIGRVIAAFVLLTLVMALVPTVALAQEEKPSKVDIFGGYSWYNPGGKLPTGQKLPSIAKGWGAAATYNVNRYFGIAVDAGGHYKTELNTSTVMGGPQLKFHSDMFTPFTEVLFGMAHVSPAGLSSRNAFALAAGGGLDVKLTHYVSWRILQADYLYTTYKIKEQPLLPTSRLDGARVQSGLVINLGGGTEQLPVTASCSAQPTEVMAGEPVKVTLTSANFNPKRTLSYNWTATGGKVSGTETTATVDTNGMAPGSYTVNGKVTDNGKGKKQMSASCSSNFTILEPPKHPPTISCSANPTTVKSGDPATITAQATSPDNRPLSYTWTATGGKVTGTGETATLDTAGAPAGPITVNGTVSDDRNLTASCSSSVNVEVPPPPPTSSKINQISFPDTKKPARVDNAAKAILDDVALRLQREADAKAVVIGYATADETKKKSNKNLAAQRAFNTKEYLTKEKGIDPSRIEIRTGTGENQTAEIWLVPTGASFTGEGTTVVDETKMVAPAKKPVKKAKKAAAAPAQ